MSSLGITTKFIWLLKKSSSFSNLSLCLETSALTSWTDFFKKSSGLSVVYPLDDMNMKIMKNDIFLIMLHILVYNLLMSPIKFKNFFSVLTVSLAVILSLLLAFNAKNVYSSDDDPLEPINRAIFGFNEVIDDAVLEPVAKGYRAITPDPVEKSVSNFFNNLGEINNIFNSTLQLKLDKTLSSSARFVINSTVGVFGLFDIATSLGIERHREDFGQTLGHYGVPAGPYLVLPFFGPSTFRDAPGFYADIAVEKSISPVHTELHHEERQLIQATNVIDTRANLLQATKILDTAAKDKYIFLRESYLQKRTKMIADGKNVQDFEIDVLEINY